MAASIDLSVAKKNLSETLGESMKLYLQLLKSWFKQKISRETFDYEARKFLPQDSIHLHNQFLLAIFAKCQMFGSSSLHKESSVSTQVIPSKHVVKKPLMKKKRLHSSSKSGHQNRFLPANPLSQAPRIPPHIPEPEERGPGYVSREMTLPDIGMVHGRLIVAAWDFGLDEVEDNAVRILMQAVEIQLKNVLSAAIARRKGYKLREGCFKYGIGSYIPQSHLMNSAIIQDSSLHSDPTMVSSKGYHMPSLRPSLETGLRDVAMELACGGPVKPTQGPLTLFDVYSALQVHKSAIPSHTVYATNMERIQNKLWHPSSDDLDQQQIHRQEVAIKRELIAQQQAIIKS